MRSVRAVAIAATLCIAAPASPAPSAPRQAVEAAMTDSAAGWNAGDVDRFMRIYSDAPETSFVTSKGLLRGKAAMIARYRARYDFAHPQRLGRLTFTTLDFRSLDARHALYIGQYLLTYPDGRTETGPTTLVFARERAGWKIIADHSG